MRNLHYRQYGSLLDLDSSGTSNSPSRIVDIPASHGILTRAVVHVRTNQQIFRVEQIADFLRISDGRGVLSHEINFPANVHGFECIVAVGRRPAIRYCSTGIVDVLVVAGSVLPDDVSGDEVRVFWPWQGRDKRRGEGGNDESVGEHCG
jgi:hypothetical protein